MSPQCDFCDSHDVRYRYDAESFMLHIYMTTKGNDTLDIPWASQNGWAACEHCSFMIEAGDWDGLAQHSVDTNPALAEFSKVLVEGEVKKAALELHREFQKHRIGERREVRRAR